MDLEKAIALLGLDRHVSKKEMQRRYRELLKANHPDLNPDNASATRATVEIIDAYEFLLKVRQAENWTSTPGARAEGPASAGGQESAHQRAGGAEAPGATSGAGGETGPETAEASGGASSSGSHEGSGGEDSGCGQGSRDWEWSVDWDDNPFWSAAQVGDFESQPDCLFLLSISDRFPDQAAIESQYERSWREAQQESLRGDSGPAMGFTAMAHAFWLARCAAIRLRSIEGWVEGVGRDEEEVDFATDEAEARTAPVRDPEPVAASRGRWGLFVGLLLAGVALLGSIVYLVNSGRTNDSGPSGDLARLRYVEKVILEAERTKNPGVRLERVEIGFNGSGFSSAQGDFRTGFMVARMGDEEVRFVFRAYVGENARVGGKDVQWSVVSRR